MSSALGAYDTREWLLGFLEDNRREAARLAKGETPQRERYLNSLKRSKPWPRKTGLRMTHKPLMWRP